MSRSIAMAALASGVHSITAMRRGVTAPLAVGSLQIARTLQGLTAPIVVTIRGRIAAPMLAAAYLVARVTSRVSSSIYLGSCPADTVYVGPREEDELYLGRSNLFPEHTE